MPVSRDGVMRLISKKIIMLIAFSILIVVIAVFLLNRSTGPRGAVTIKNINTCSKGINPAILEDVSKTIYDFVDKANEYNKQQTLEHYNAIIRDKSCTKSVQLIKTPGGKSREVKSAVVIIDVREANQSWKFSYDWLDEGVPVDTVINGATPECLAKSELIYGEFNCEKILNIDTYGTDAVDPIQPYMPYDGAGFRLEYNPDTKTVSVIILPPPGTKDVAAFTENTKAIIPYWFQKRGLDQSKYRVLYNSNIVDD